MKTPSILLIITISIFCSHDALSDPSPLEALRLEAYGKTTQALTDKFGTSKLLTFRDEGTHRWITFHSLKAFPPHTLVTFHCIGGKVIDVAQNDREEIAKEYLGEFASGNILGSFPNIREALLKAMTKLPIDVFMAVTPRKRPTLFIDVYTSGIARFANSLDFTMRKDDPETFQEGFYLIKLGDELNNTDDPESIEGVIYHELAHRVLNHLHTDDVDSCDMEREANRLIKQWGFEKEFLKAKEAFGSKRKGDSPCADKLT